MTLCEVIAGKNLDALSQALEQGADVNAVCTGNEGWTPLHEAIEQLEDGGSIEAIVLLLRYGADPDAWDGSHDATSFLMAVFRGNAEAVRLLLAAGGDPNVTGGEGDTALRWCVEHGNLAMSETLLRCGAKRSIDSSGGPSGMTALGRAVHRLDLPMVQLLLRCNADPEALDADHCTARQRIGEGSDDPGTREAIHRLLSHPNAPDNLLPGS